jgi:hypothetical protein
MRESAYLTIVALASMLVAPPFSVFAQQDPPIVNPPIVNPPLVDLPIVAPPIVAPPVVRPPRPQAFGGRVDATAGPASPQKPKRAFYYRPGDLKGVPYDTIEGCTKAVQRAGDVGICVYK